MKRVLTTGAVVLLSVTGLVGCGGDDQSFCDAVTVVQEKGAALSALDLPALSDDRVDEAKDAVLELAEAIRDAIEAAPEDVGEVLEGGLPLIDDAIAEIEDATTIQQLIEEGEDLVAVLQTTPQPRPGARQDLSQAIADECAEAPTE